MPNPVIYFRASLAEEEEMSAASEHFRVVTQRTHVKPGELVIPRYSALPNNRELCDDIVELGGQPINSYREHCYVADLKNWYQDLKGLTPRTWFSLDQIPRDDDKSFVLKGECNSLKRLWASHMFARDWCDATDVYLRLQDSLIGEQAIYIREYVPLRQLATAINGMPVSEEYRFFCLEGDIVASGFYWSGHVDQLDRVYTSDVVPRGFIQQVIDIVAPNVRFFVFDVARTEAGEWIVIELNDGCQSGLSEINPRELYSNLKRVLA